ncbi:hypothetical protein SKAU_G00168420 [Synaphobranchus kaupii]|uniref:Kinesin motor domain-containing protein n=1 Tax=Synaphobranchus kaupii TaxID=118154 RepID=A0A9Q1J0K7_SYNKA|nr:hypothetical protein SKAU_G00168420 [Synaphobranchus kaupii]
MSSSPQPACDVSSPSHAIFTISLTQATFDVEMPSETVDLVGRERADASGATGARLYGRAKHQAVSGHAGQCHHCLGIAAILCLAAAGLSQSAGSSLMKRKRRFVPHRDSVLTWHLKDSIGGNSKTIKISTSQTAHNMMAALIWSPLVA